MRVRLDDSAVGGFGFEWLRVLSQESTGGAVLGECIAVANRIRDNDFGSWTASWSSLADHILQQGKELERSGHQVSAQRCYLRASNYYRAAAFYADPGRPEHGKLFFASRDCFRRSIEAGLAAEPITLPFEGRHLPGYFLRCARTPAPTLIAHGGFDSTAEELYHWIGVHAVERGWNCVIFEGPGQWGPVFEEPPLLMRPDWENPVRAVVEWSLSRPEVDAEWLALIGYSLGGYLAPRAAAFEPRIRACIASPLANDIGAAFETLWPAFVRFLPAALWNAVIDRTARLSTSGRWALQHARWATGIRHAHETLGYWRSYTLNGLESRLTCPLLALVGEDDIAAMPTKLVLDTIDFAGRLPRRPDFHLFARADGGASHCQMEAIPTAAAAAMDWLDDQVRGKRTENARSMDDLIETVAKHHGADAAARARSTFSR